MKKERKDKHFIKKPRYPGGPRALKAFISQHLRYPDEARKHGVEGTVTVRYTIDQKGQVVDARIIAGLGHGCDEEAIRVVKLLRFDVPKNPVRVLFHKTIHIHFHPKKPATVHTTVQYELKPASREGAESRKEDKDENGGYTWTISW